MDLCSMTLKMNVPCHHRHWHNKALTITALSTLQKKIFMAFNHDVPIEVKISQMGHKIVRHTWQVYMPLFSMYCGNVILCGCPNTILRIQWNMQFIQCFIYRNHINEITPLQNSKISTFHENCPSQIEMIPQYLLYLF